MFWVKSFELKLRTVLVAVVVSAAFVLTVVDADANAASRGLATTAQTDNSCGDIEKSAVTSLKKLEVYLSRLASRGYDIFLGREYTISFTPGKRGITWVDSRTGRGVKDNEVKLEATRLEFTVYTSKGRIAASEASSAGRYLDAYQQVAKAVAKTKDRCSSMNGRIPSITARQLLKAFKRLGWKEARSNGGSHLILEDPKSGIVLPVPVHPSSSLGRGLVRTILQEAKIPVKEFLSAL